MRPGEYLTREDRAALLRANRAQYMRDYRRMKKEHHTTTTTTTMLPDDDQKALLLLAALHHQPHTSYHHNHHYFQHSSPPHSQSSSNIMQIHIVKSKNNDRSGGSHIKFVWKMEDAMRNMLLTFRVSELQMLLGYAGLNKTGRKTELQARAIELLKNKSVPHLTQIHAKIRELYKTIQQGGSVQQGQGVVGGGDGSGSGGVNQARVAPTSLISPQPQVPPPAQSSVPQSQAQQQQRALIQPQPQPPPLHTFIPISSRSNMYGSMYGYQPKVTSLQTQSPVYPIQPDVRFKRLPFFDVLGELLKPSSLVPNSNQRNQEGNFVFYLTPQQASDVAINRDIGPGTKIEYLIQLQLRFCLMETSCEQEDMFPPGVVVKVNNKVCPLPNPIPTNKPGVEPKRPPRPVNISSLVKLSPSVANHINVSWTAEYGRGYVLSVNLVRKLTATDLLSRLKSKGIRHADFTTGLIKEKLSEDADTEIATTSLRVSLLCPLGKMRMVTPCRSTTCTHLQCFDASLFLQMNEKKPTWTCPVCDRPALYDNLVIDGYFQDVLCSNRLAADSHEIQLHQDGSWSSHIPKKDQAPTSCLLTMSPSSHSADRHRQLTPNKVEPIEEILDDSERRVPSHRFLKALLDLLHSFVVKRQTNPRRRLKKTKTRKKRKPL